MSLDDLNRCSIDSWWISCCCWSIESRRGVVDNAVVAMGWCSFPTSSSTWMFLSLFSTSTKVFSDTLTFSCYDNSSFQASVQNGDKIASQLFSRFSILLKYYMKISALVIIKVWLQFIFILDSIGFHLTPTTFVSILVNKMLKIDTYKYNGILILVLNNHNNKIGLFIC